MSQHEPFMRRCFELARLGEGRVDPNPLVGAVVVRGGRIVGEGAHRRFGGPHAEVEALKRAGSKAQGATLYVNLEPCSPHPKKTPPCTELLIRSKIRQIVVAMKDPNPAVCGRGLSLLRRAGRKILTGVLESEARALNAIYAKYQTQRLPYVISKWAMTLDGKIATTTGDSKWITSLQSRRRVRELRSRIQAILVGSNTARRDDPRLSAPGRAPTRIVLDTEATLALTSRLVRTARDQRTIVAVGAGADRKRMRALEQQGCEVLQLEVLDLRVLFEALAGSGISSILIEGGGEVHASALRDGLVDEVWAFVAPKIVGGATAKTPVGGGGIPLLADALALRDVQIERIGPDVLIRGKLEVIRA